MTALSTSRILLCFPIISIIKVAWIWSPISFFIGNCHFHNTVIFHLLNRLNQGPCKYFLKTMIKVEGWAGFSKVVWVSWMRPKLDGQKGAGDGFGDCCGFARPTLVQKADWFSGCDHSLIRFAIPQLCGVKKNPSNDIVLSLWLYSIVLYQKVE